MNRYRFIYVDSAVWGFQDKHYHSGIEGPSHVEAYVNLVVAMLVAGGVPQPGNVSNPDDLWRITAPRHWANLDDNTVGYTYFTPDEWDEIAAALEPWLRGFNEVST